MNIGHLEWNEGEDRMHRLLHVPPQDNPTSPGLSPHAQRLLHLSTLIAIGVIDKHGNPWTTILGGEPGFTRSIGQSIVGVKVLADLRYDPVLETILANRNEDDSVSDRDEYMKYFSALGIHLASRDRVKLQGQLLAAGTVGVKNQPRVTQEDIGEVQMALGITGSLGNCPKYINKRDIVLTPPKPVLLADSLPLSEPALAILAQADLFFMTSYQPSHMSTNNRGGLPGFIRVEKNDASGCILVYPEYSGNRLYQTLGNLYLDPRAGLAIPDFSTGNILYLTCTTKILFGETAASTLPRSNLAVQLLITAARLVERGLGFRGVPGERSPYSPPIRYLPQERNSTDAQAQSGGDTAYAKLLSRTLLTPTIARFKFSISDPKTAGHWTPGQYVALAFEDELSGGYAHMNDADPKSLNDDYVRTFTVSSPPYASGCGGKLQQDEFEITIRNVGKVTDFLFKINLRAGLEVPLRGFAGTFSIEQSPNGSDIVPFVAGGIGITPLLAQLGTLDMSRLKAMWAVNIRDVGLVVDTIQRCPALARAVTVYLSGLTTPLDQKSQAAMRKVEGAGVEVVEGRLMEKHVKIHQDLDTTWYLCTGPAMRKSLLDWLKGKVTVYEDFDY